jgi:penicillin-binding protein 1A
MKGALAKSLNTVSVEVLLDGGISNTIDIAKKLGISADLPDYPSLALGVASVSLKEIVEAYAGIVNDGKPVEAHYLVEIADKDGNVLEKFNYSPAESEVVSPENCRAIINMMQAVVNEGTGSAIRSRYNIDGDFAGKTGTTQENSDGWFVGITPNLVTGCWVGADDPRVHFRSITYGQGAYMALPIVGSFFSKTYRDPKFQKIRNSTFTQPAPELLAMLDNPQYREVMEIEKRDFELADIFRSKTKKEELKKAETKSEPAEKTAEQEEKPVWTKIKSIFKKKEK